MECFHRPDRRGKKRIECREDGREDDMEDMRNLLLAMILEEDKGRGTRERRVQIHRVEGWRLCVHIQRLVEE